MLIVTPTRRGYMPPERSGRPELLPRCMGCVAHRISGIGWGYVKQVEIVGDDRSSPRNGLGLSERPVSIRTDVDGEM